MNFRKTGNIVLVLNLTFFMGLHYIEYHFQTDLCKNSAIIFHFPSSLLICGYQILKGLYVRKTKIKNHTHKNNKKPQIQWNFNFSKYFKMNNTII